MSTNIIAYDSNSIGETGHTLFLYLQDGTLVNTGGTVMTSEANGRFVYDVTFDDGQPTEICRALTKNSFDVASLDGWYDIDGDVIVDCYPETTYTPLIIDGTIQPALVDGLIKLRNYIDDLDSDNYTYSDDRLKQLLLVAACYVQADLSLTYTVSLNSGTISEDPSGEIVNIIVLKAACLLGRAESKSSANSNVKVVDGPSTIDVGGIYKSILENAKSACAEYEKAKVDYALRYMEGCSSITPTTTYYRWT